MTTFAVLATGPSMSAELAQRLSNGMDCIAVNDAYKIAPDAVALCANDRVWWSENPAAMTFRGRRFSTAQLGRGVEAVPMGVLIGPSTNSALLALHVAIAVFGATEVMLYGVDMHGSHYFGRHAKLNNTSEHRFEVFKRQFGNYAQALKDVTVWNATPGSALRCFPFLN